MVGSNFFFSFFKNSVLKTHFDDGTENDFFFSVKCLYEFSVDFFLFVFFFSKQKSDFFLCYREFWPLCSGVDFFFSEPVVRLLCSHKLRPSKRPQSLEKLSDFPITLIHFIYNFWENLANFANKRDLFAVLISRVFFFFFSLAEQSKKDSEITEQLLELLLQHASAFQLQVLRCYLLHASALLIGCFQEIAKICFENRQTLWRLFTLTYLHISQKHFIFPKREWILEC